MIGRLRGMVLESQLDGSVVVDVGGVGYEVHMPLGAVGRLTADAGDGEERYGLSWSGKARARSLARTPARRPVVVVQ